MLLTFLVVQYCVLRYLYSRLLAYYFFSFLEGRGGTSVTLTLDIITVRVYAIVCAYCVFVSASLDILFAFANIWQVLF